MEGLTGFIQIAEGVVKGTGFVAVLGAICYAPMCFILKQKERRRRLRKHPFGESIPRAPGEYLREKREDRAYDGLEMFLMPGIVLIVGTPLVMSLNAKYPLAPYVLAATCLILSALMYRRLNAWAKEQWNLRLGEEGERFVAHQLDKLKAQGYLVFHDLQFENYNIDHVVLGAGGLFVIETKTRRKPEDHKPESGHVVTFDGEVIRWNGFRETRSVKQAINNARSLSKHLANQTGEPVFAQAIVAIPGWFVEIIQSNPDVFVVSGRGLESFISKFTRPIESGQLRRMAYQLEKLSCRQVA